MYSIVSEATFRYWPTLLMPFATMPLKAYITLFIELFFFLSVYRIVNARHKVETQGSQVKKKLCREGEP